ncbi:hypothetical protein EDB81DRAFT_887753 [Dactylonectria macrodidyma]|uniref:Uncharacterized protein n=1 Tax=Dactylonectria macrodidyma TaxID=307937 RepID=A0A9P9E9P3_9HYPO|nr:hypothetical protein EDB81DRAFT_887753 [Dactylonectria macrodidyma]
MVQLSLPGTPTNLNGNTIDLAFTNVPSAAHAIVDEALVTGSDHFTIDTTIPATSSQGQSTGKIRISTEEEIKRFGIAVREQAKHIPATNGTSEELEGLAAAITGAIQIALKVTGSRLAMLPNPHPSGPHSATKQWQNTTAFAANTHLDMTG